MSFKDHFSPLASDYFRYRPSYPQELFDYLASLVKKRERAWDCATGNGQAALGLARYFDEVIATDASEQQLSNAVKHEKIKYSIATAEQSNIEADSVDLVTVAQAMHWFDLEGFYKEVKRVLRPGGVIAAWIYRFIYVSDEIDPLLEEVHNGALKPFWPPETVIADERFLTIPFPFEEIRPPLIHMEASWDMQHLVGFLRTWSASKLYREQMNADPLETITDRLRERWGDPLTQRNIRWPLILRVGRMPDLNTSESK